MKQVEFTEQEEKALLGLLDAACRQAGLQAANPAAVWADKLKNAEELKEGPAPSYVDGAGQTENN